MPVIEDILNDSIARTTVRDTKEAARPIFRLSFAAAFAPENATKQPPTVARIMGT